jgi:acyl-CoA synthetase (NDP forming)
MTAPTDAATARPSLDALFHARSVAVIGASDDRSKLAGRVLSHLLRHGFEGDVLPVNPRRETVQGVPCHPAVGALPVIPDLALVTVPAAACEAAVRECADAGVRAAVITSAGFAETGADGVAAQARIVETARAAGMRLLGPNCLGLANTATGLCASFSATFNRGLPTPGPVGVVSQSGAYGSHVLHLTESRGIGVTYWLTTGNEADISVSEGLHWMAERPEVEVVLCYVEGVKDGQRFADALRAAHRTRTPIVMIKSGSSAAGEKAAGSHTGSFTGSDAVFDLMLQEYGVYRARTIEEQLDVVYAAQCTRPTAGRRLGVVTLSGGIGAQLCDAADRYGLSVPEFPVEARTRVQELLPYATVTNPIDVTAQVLQDTSVLTAAVEAILDERSYDAIVAFFSTVLLNQDTADAVLASMRQALTHRADELVAICMIAARETVAAFEEAGCLVFEDPDRAVRAVAALARFAEALDRPVPASHGVAAATRLTGPYDEVMAKSVLAEAGVPILTTVSAGTADEAVQAAREVGLPVALKVVSADVAHKSDAGGVALGLATEDEVRAAFDKVTSSVGAAHPHARIGGVAVSPMARPGGVEMIAGVTRDPVFGPVVLLGLGGIYVETMRDTTTRLAPVDPAGARAMVGDLRGAGLLTGARGRPPLAVDGLADAVAALSRFAAAHPEVASVEVNPLVVWEDEVAALDAVLTIDDTPEATR